MPETDTFRYTATGMLGDKRETMLQNELHLRPELGRPLQRGYTLPPGMFTYGRANTKHDGGTSEAMTGWSTKSKLPFNRKEGAKTERDFMSLNRAAVLMGLVTAPEHYQFRATHDVQRKIKSEDGKRAGTTRRLPPTMVFGISTRPSTPVYDLLEHKYQDRWLSEQRGQELSKHQKEEKKKTKSGKIYETRASLLRVHQERVDAAPLWQLPRFSKSALPCLHTFRSDRDKREAFKHNQSDCISRRGVFGHGVYEQARS